MKQLSHIYILLFLFLSFGQTLWGQASRDVVLKIDNEFYEQQLKDWYSVNSYVLMQQELPLDFDPITSNFSDNWQALPNDIKWEKNLWLKLTIQNITSSNLDLILLLHSDVIDLYYQDEQQNWQYQKGGNLYPRAEWDSRQHEPVYTSPHTFQFAAAAQRSTTLYFKLGPADLNFDINLRLCNRPFFLSHSNNYFQRTIASQSFFLGLMAIMMLFPFGMFVLNKDRAYLFYGCYVFFIALYLAYAFEFQNFTFLAEYPRIGRVIHNASGYLFSYHV